MELRRHAVIMFSEDLAEKTLDERVAALAKLRGFLAANEEICGSGTKLDRAFEPFRSTPKHPQGEIDDLSAFATSLGNVFTPEVVRGDVSEQEASNIESMGFQVQRFEAPAYT